jgi:uncharacterized membrane protein
MEYYHLLPTTRTEALSDGIFAFAMTLLVLDLQFPDAALVSGTPLYKLLIGQLPRFINYFTSFILLAVFWVVHHNIFHHIKRSNQLVLWLNVLLLSFVVLIPFSTSLVGDYDAHVAAEVFFAGNLFIIGMLNFTIWTYATWKKRLTDPDLDEEFIKEARWQNLAVPGVSLLAMAVAFFSPTLSGYVYFLIFFILAGRRHVLSKRSNLVKQEVI